MAARGHENTGDWGHSDVTPAHGEYAGVSVTDDIAVGAAMSTVEPFDTVQCWRAGDGWYPRL